MTTARDLVPLVKVRLGHPPVEKVRLVDIVLTIGQVVGDLSTSLKNMDQSWFFLKGTFTIHAGKADFKAELPNFSKTIAVEWINPYNPDGPGIEVQVRNFQDLDLTMLGDSVPYGENIAYGIDVENIPRAVGFMNIAAGTQIDGRAVPTPRTDQRCRIYYDPANQPLTSYLADIQFPQEHMRNLLVYRTADMLLGNCGYDEKEWMQKKSSIDSGLEAAEENFRKWRGQSKHQQVRASQPYAPPTSYGSWGRRGSR